MKKTFLLLLFSFMTSQINFGQVYLQWVDRYNFNNNFSPNYGYNINHDTHGNIYVTGVSSGNLQGRLDMILLSFSESGNLNWLKRFADTITPPSLNNWNAGSSILFDGSYNIFIGGSRIWNYTSTGELIWNVFTPYNKGFAKIFFDKNYGILSSTEFANNSFLIRKYSYSGDSLWEKRFKPEGTIAARWKDAAKDNEDNIITAGYMNKPGIGDEYDFMTVKYSSNGNYIWANRFDQGIDNLCYAMTVDDSNNVYVTGNTQNANYDMVTIKYSHDGSLIWQKIFNGGSGDTGYDIEVDKNDNVYVAGRAGGLGLTLTKYDKNGNEIWFRNRPDNALGNYPVLRLDRENNPYVAFFLVTPQGGETCAIEKYDTAGNSKWHAKYSVDSTTSLQKINDFFIDSTFSIYATGRSNNKVMTLKYVQIPTAVNETTDLLVKNFYLSQNYPNPFNPTTNLGFGISELGFISLKVYDSQGKEVATLVNENKEPGYYNLQFDGSKLSSGVYYYRLESKGLSQTKRMMLLK